MLIDFHTHRVRETEPTIEVISLHGDQQDRPFKYYTHGYHPWWTIDLLSSEHLNRLSDGFTNDDHCLGIGECGLDNLKGAHIELQEKIFIQQIELANALDAPIIVHCVRAYDRAIQLRKKYGQTPWVVHGFVRNKILAKQLLDAGFQLSLAPTDHVTENFIETCRYVPLNRLFLETDSESSIPIGKRYQIFADLRGFKMEDLKEQLYTNFKEFFKKKWKHPNG
jgi:TatD DNase family protein